MSRSLLVLGAIAAAIACGIWGQATRARVSTPARAPIPAARIGSTPAIAPVVATNPASPRKSIPAVKARRAVTVPAERREHGAASAPAAPSAAPRLGAAMRIVTDPVAEQSGSAMTIPEMQDLAHREAAGLATIHNPDGSETINHEGRFADYTIMRVGPDGKPTFVCVQGEEAAKRALAAPIATSKKEGK